MRVHRLISILLLIESRGKVKAKEIAQKFEISERTVYRDIDALCEAGIPVVTTTGPNGGIYLIDEYTVGLKNFNEEDILNMHLIGKGIKPDKNTDMALKINNTLLKLQKKTSLKQRERINIIEQRFYFDEKPWWGNASRIKNVNNILNGVFKSKPLNIKYKKFSGEISERKILPYGIVVKKDEWYLIAYCTKSKDIRTFKCERIIEDVLQEENFTMPKGFSIIEYWNTSKKRFKDMCEQREIYPVVVKVKKDKICTLNFFEVISKKHIDDEYIEVTIDMKNSEYAKNNISMIISCEILSPIEIRMFAKNEIKNILLLYEK
ncbi:WYL domain-containing protein [Clostridiaceae bacterium M8S5]|nr:WYL domain-containing protein [Clostridiaceae bacterium M8S5]